MKHKTEIRPYIDKAKVGVIGSWLASLGAILASSCCILPIIFLNLGIGGAWIANLAMLQPYREHMIVAALALFAASLFFYMRMKKCETETSCRTECRKHISAPVLFFIAAILIAAALIWPQIEPQLLRAIR